MGALKYVCLSDLHLGADYSVLTWMDADGTTNLLKPSPTLSALGTGLRQYVQGLSGRELPTLILLGDVLDLGQSPFGAVAQESRWPMSSRAWSTSRWCAAPSPNATATSA